MPSFTDTEQKIRKLFEIKLQAFFSGFECNLINTLKYRYCIVLWTEFKSSPP